MESVNQKLNIGDELEKQLIALALHDREFFIHCNTVLKSKHFEDVKLGQVWGMLQIYFNKHSTLPSIAVIVRYFQELYKELDEGKFRKDLAHYDIGSKEWIKTEVIKRIKHQEFSVWILKAAKEVDAGNANFDNLEADLKKIVQINPDVNLGTDYFDIQKRYAKILSQIENKISTGFPTLDKYLGGGFAPKELYAWLSSPGLGKSTWLTGLGKNLIIQGCNVVHYSFEMSEERVGLRYDAAILNETTKDLIGNWQSAVQRLEKIKKHLKSRHVIKEYPTKTANVNHLRSHLHKLKEYQDFIPDILLVDYGDIMRSIYKKNDRYEEQGEVFEELRALAQEYEIPVITATQTNRNALSKNIVTMEDIADSFQKVRTVDFLAAINQKPEEKEMGIQRLYIAKNRNNIDGVILVFKCDYAKMQLEDIGENKTEAE